MAKADALTTAAAVSLERVKGDIVTGTLDKLNNYTVGGKKKSKYSAQAAMNDAYDFNKSVLSAAYSDTGGIIDTLK